MVLKVRVTGPVDGEVVGHTDFDDDMENKDEVPPMKIR